MLIDDGHDIITNVRKLRLKLLPVFSDRLNILVVSFALLLLLNRGQDPPRSSPRSNHILVPHRKQVSLLHRQLHIELRKILHRIHHFYHNSAEETPNPPQLGPENRITYQIQDPIKTPAQKVFNHMIK